MKGKSKKLVWNKWQQKEAAEGRWGVLFKQSGVDLGNWLTFSKSGVFVTNIFTWSPEAALNLGKF